MILLNYALFLILQCCIGKLFALHYVGRQDEIFCGSRTSIRSCNHQLEDGLRQFVNCSVEPIPRDDCPTLGPLEFFSWKNLPFELHVYKVLEKGFQAVGLNISFTSSISWKELTLYLENQRKPKVKACQRIHLSGEDSLVAESRIHWDCVPFLENSFQANYFDLYLQDNRNLGGIFSFRVPAIENYDINTTFVANWNVFFFIHRHYIDHSGQVIVTLQPAPFSNISYSIAFAKCLNPNLDCKDRVTLVTKHIFQSKFLAAEAQPMTVELMRVTSCGSYIVSIQILSSKCTNGHCAISVSPILEITPSYTLLIIFSIFGIAIMVGLASWFGLRKITRSFHDYLAEKREDSVLFVYHADSMEKALFIDRVAQVFQDNLYVQPLLVDKDVGLKDPNDWIRYQLCHSSKVLFFIPSDIERESATPVQHQWHCAVNYFSGGLMKRNRERLSACAAVVLPDSSPLTHKDEISSLVQFELRFELTALADWLHRNSFLDRILFWRPLAEVASKAIFNPSFNSYESGKSELSLDSAIKAPYDHLGSTLIPLSDSTKLETKGCDDKTLGEFDPLLPDVCRIRFEEDLDSSTSSELPSSKSWSSDCYGGSSDDIMNVAS